MVSQNWLTFRNWFDPNEWLALGIDSGAKGLSIHYKFDVDRRRKAPVQNASGPD